MTKPVKMMALFAWITLSLGSCKLSEKTVKRIIEPRSSEQIVTDLKKNELRFKTLSAKANVVVSGENKVSFKANFRIRKDSAIWVYFSYIGFSGARVIITNDSVKMINYKDETYFIESFDALQKAFNIDATFEQLQAFLIGNSFELPPAEEIITRIEKGNYYLSSVRKRQFKKDKAEKRIDRMEKKQEKKPEKAQKKIDKNPAIFREQIYSLTVDPDTYKIKSLELKDYEAGQYVNARFSNHQPAGDQLYPEEIVYYLNTSKSNKKISLNYSKFVIDKEVEFRFNIPSKYEQIFL